MYGDYRDEPGQEQEFELPDTLGSPAVPVESNQSKTSPSPSFSPRLVKTMNFGQAMDAVASGKKVRGVEWPKDGAYVFLRASIVHIRKGDGSEHQLAVSDGDILATWELVEGVVQ